jgi:hypothetical protein
MVFMLLQTCIDPMKRILFSIALMTAAGGAVSAQNVIVPSPVTTSPQPGTLQPGTTTQPGVYPTPGTAPQSGTYQQPAPGMQPGSNAYPGTNTGQPTRPLIVPPAPGQAPPNGTIKPVPNDPNNPSPVTQPGPPSQPVQPGGLRPRN